ncbi:MAG: TRAP transporter large permease subunit [Sneathiellaceae bacterium]
MDPVTVGIVLTVVLLVALAAGIWVAVSLVIVGAVGMMMFSSAPVGSIAATKFWELSSSIALTALPLFIWMGEILFRTQLSANMFSGLAPWLTRLPGRLMHTNVLGCGIFAAVSGSSTATCVTIGRMSLPELKKRGYDEKMSIGSLASAGALGLMIPPSIIMIVYGVAAEVSIARLFIAGILPGLLMMFLFMGYIAIMSVLQPSRTPASDIAMSFVDKVRNSWQLLPVVILILGVIGSIYGGLATATESAAVGVVGALLIAAGSRTLTWASFTESLMAATRTSCMLALILSASAFLSTAMGFTGIPRFLATTVSDMQLDPAMLLVVLTLLFIVLGCFLDGVSVIVLTTSVVMPMIAAAGIDPIWFGIYLVIVVEMSVITPPVGFNLYVLQSLTGRDIFFIAAGCLPFFLLMVLTVVILILVPEVATFLPDQMYSN